MRLTLTQLEKEIVADALRDYAEGSDKYEADDEAEARTIARFGEAARAVLARIEDAQ